MTDLSIIYASLRQHMSESEALFIEAAFKAEKERLQRVIERDRSKAAMILEGLRRAIGRRSWLAEPGRGSYASDDELYQQEFGTALEEIRLAIEPLAAYAKDWSDCPTDPKQIQKARNEL